MEAIDSKNLNDAAEQIVKELASRNIGITDLDTVFKMVKEKVNNMIIVSYENQKSKEMLETEALFNSVQNEILRIFNSELESF